MCLSIKDALKTTCLLFQEAGIESPRLDAELLLANAMNCNTIDLYTNHSLRLDGNNKPRFDEIVKMLLARMPIQYILGNTEFMSLSFIVNKDVLIPRPETELIVESVLEIANYGNKNDIIENQNALQLFESKRRKLKPEAGSITIVDLGTGSGNIAVSIAVMLKNAIVFACDMSNKALSIARANAMRHKVADRVNFLQGDLFDAFKSQDIDLKADFIVSNPPYVAECELAVLQPEIVKYEPIQALDGGKDGLDFYRAILAEAENWLKKDGYIILEVGEKQLSDIKNLIDIYKNQKSGCKSGIKFVKTVKDLQGIERVVIAQAY
mgnify:CR=1 FL=1